MNPELSQPYGSINYNNILFIKNNKRYTTFETEKISSNNFGINVHHLHLIYKNCISSSRNQIKYYPILFNEFIIKKEFELPYVY
jgi:hypothetical protein